MKEFVKKHKALMIALLAFVVLIIAYSITASKWKKEDAVKHLESLDGNGNDDGTLYDMDGNISTDGTGMTWDALVAAQTAIQQVSQSQNPMYDTSMGGGDNSQQGGGDSGGGSSGGGGDSSTPSQYPVTNPTQQSAVTPPPIPAAYTPLVLGGNVMPTPTSSLGLGAIMNLPVSTNPTTITKGGGNVMPTPTSSLGLGAIMNLPVSTNPTTITKGGGNVGVSRRRQSSSARRRH